jgi:hypothetical protein
MKIILATIFEFAIPFGLVYLSYHVTKEENVFKSFDWLYAIIVFAGISACGYITFIKKNAIEGIVSFLLSIGALCFLIYTQWENMEFNETLFYYVWVVALGYYVGVKGSGFEPPKG